MSCAPRRMAAPAACTLWSASIWECGICSWPPLQTVPRSPSKRWRKTAARIGRVHARAANIRADVLHKATTRLAQRHQVIVIEDLAVANMTRRKPGAGRGGRGLNRALADAAPAELRRQLG